LVRAEIGPRLTEPWAALSGGAAVIAAGVVAHAAVSIVRVSGLLRGLGLASLVVACLWLPTALGAAVLPESGGPIAALYARLGEPQAGRWTAAVLALVLQVLVSAPLSARAVAVGRVWMRADAPEFRRRLVRVVAGWPAVAAAVVLAFHWGWTPWFAWWPVAVMAALLVRVR
jgi:hypothetical protein